MAATDFSHVQLSSYEYAYTHRDVILYALSIGCDRTQLRYVYEYSPDFAALPTFAVIPAFGFQTAVPMEQIVHNFNPEMLLHGEQYLELKGALPTAGTLLNTPRIVDVQDKEKAAVVVLSISTTNAETGELIAENEFTTFIRGAGGFGKRPAAPRKEAAVAANQPPKTPPDCSVTERTHPGQAALYRLNGDWNPLHIDPEFSKGGGFEKPILHGLCTFGMAVKHVLSALGNDDPNSVRSIKVRFAGHVIPGETLQTDMWVVSPTKVVFQTKVVSRNAVAISHAAVVFKHGVLQQPRHRL
ncbi:hypothetical protein WJX72_008882 [[Myrmecia] bisecta]|uniref:MaoC-like domain-containing protein n=1 Tax=[Myrmecia] bisecta TaxID=41462 RepID=A0AAW1QSW0_9CHLO